MPPPVVLRKILLVPWDLVIGPILILISWILLRLEGRNLSELGFNRPWKRLGQFTAGFVIAGIVVVIQQLALSRAVGVPWALNPDIDGATMARSLRLNVNSVLFEELIFRGYPLLLAIRWLGVPRGVALGAAAFGVYHWFSYGVFGNPVMMGFVFVLTGAFGFMLALAFAKTASVAGPIGLHLGWNLVAYLGFSGGPFGPGIWVPADPPGAMEATGGIALLLNLGIPFALVFVVTWFLLRSGFGGGAPLESGVTESTP